MVSTNTNSVPQSFPRQGINLDPHKNEQDELECSNISNNDLEDSAKDSFENLDALVSSLQNSAHDNSLNFMELNETCQSVLQEVSALRRVFGVLIKQAKQDSIVFSPEFIDTRPHTRRRGPVADLPNVLDTPLGYKPRKRTRRSE